MKPPAKYRHECTGRARPRPGWRGRQVLQVEVRWTSFDAFDFDCLHPLHTGLKWRDATWEDLQALPGFVIGRPEHPKETAP